MEDPGQIDPQNSDGKNTLPEDNLQYVQYHFEKFVFHLRKSCVVLLHLSGLSDLKHSF